MVFLIVSCDSVLQGSPDWLGSDDSPLEGFTWRGGSERDTTGILLWSEPFFCRMRNGEEVVGFLVVVFFSFLSIQSALITADAFYEMERNKGCERSRCLLIFSLQSAFIFAGAFLHLKNVSL